jgi:nucleotide-binding universal stress UspA family protein
MSEEGAMQEIVLATHGGPSADGAARVASQIAERLGVPLVCLVVYEPMPIVDYGYGITYVPTPEDDDAVRRALVASAREQFRRCGLREPTIEVRTGLIVSEIAAAASAVGARLIVAGLGSHSVVDRALGGEAALHLAQTAHTPIMAVPGQATTLPHRVLVAMDFSATSILAARVAASWLVAGDELHLMTVIPTHHEPQRAPGTPEAAGVNRLRELATELGVASGVRVEANEASGDPARTLLEQAQRVEADLLALGSHGYGAVKRLVLGSVASKVMRVSTRAILVAPVGCLEP